MIKLDLMKELKRMIAEILEYPYGKEVIATHNTLPAHPLKYAKMIDNIIDELIRLYNEDNSSITYQQIQKVRSLRENQVNKLIVDYPYHNKCPNYEMESISITIAQLLNYFIK